MKIFKEYDKLVSTHSIKNTYNLFKNKLIPALYPLVNCCLSRLGEAII